VQIVVSKGPPTVEVPDVAGMTAPDAVKAMEAVGLSVSGTDGSPSDKVKASDPVAGTVVKKGSSVKLITAKPDETASTTTTTTKPGKGN
jgi:serine/threonine-protein kinase